jgi:hypothetical protein
MSFWGATVITSLATVIPVVGKSVVHWLWGGFSIDHPTLNRFYSFHYTLPFILAGLSIFHIAALHQYGSTNPLGVNTQTSTIPFGTYFATKDLLGVFYLLLAFSILVFFYPEWLGYFNLEMAVLTGNRHYYYIAICWDYINSAQLKLGWPEPCSGVWIVIILGVLCYKSAELLNLVRLNAMKALQSCCTKLYLNSIYVLHLLTATPPRRGGCGTLFAFGEEAESAIVGKPAGNEINSTKVFKVGSSETTCGTSKYDEFNSWLAGIVDGDGSLLIGRYERSSPRTGSYTVTSFEITLDEKDLSTLQKIKDTLGYGEISKRSGAKAYRYRIAKREHILDILARINGLLLTKGKHAQLIRLCNHFNITPIIPTAAESIDIILNSAWLSGFFDAEGHFNILNKYTLAFHISQKDRFVLDLILQALNVGHIRHDISWNGWVYTISDREGIRFILYLLTKHKLQTLKQADFISLKTILSYLDKGAHLNNHSLKPNLYLIVHQFRNRHNKV